MKKLRTSIIAMAVLFIFTMIQGVAVWAADSTDLSDMTIYAVNDEGEKSEVNFDFSSDTYSYSITVTEDTSSIEIDADTADSSSTAEVEKDGVNTVMDYGTNTTRVIVTDTSGSTATYTITTTRLSDSSQDSTADNYGNTVSDDEDDDDSSSSSSKKSVTVTVDGEEFSISTSIKAADIPDGFEKTKVKYDGKKYPAIKGTKKDLVALYLYNDDTEGFYIYNESDSSFYRMVNFKIKSRMYTMITPDEADEILDNYDQEEIEIAGETVDAWVLDEDNGMYLVYAMNWNGDTSLYEYDSEEDCLQRYIVDDDVNSQVSAANKAYTKLQKKYNKLVDRYNVIIKVLCGMFIVIVILIFLCINLRLNKSKKKLKDQQKNDRSGYTSESGSEEQPDDAAGGSEEQDYEADNKTGDNDTESDVEQENAEDETIKENTAPENSGETAAEIDLDLVDEEISAMSDSKDKVVEIDESAAKEPSLNEDIKEDSEAAFKEAPEYDEAPTYDESAKEDIPETETEGAEDAEGTEGTEDAGEDTIDLVESELTSQEIGDMRVFGDQEAAPEIEIPQPESRLLSSDDDEDADFEFIDLD